MRSIDESKFDHITTRAELSHRHKTSAFDRIHSFTHRFSDFGRTNESFTRGSVLCACLFIVLWGSPVTLYFVWLSMRDGMISVGLTLMGETRLSVDSVKPCYHVLNFAITLGLFFYGLIGVIA